MSKFRVAVLAPSPVSLISTTVCAMLAARGIEVAAIGIRRFTLQRFRQEFQRDGKRLLLKIWKKLVLRERGFAGAKHETIVSFRESQGIACKSLSEFAAKHGSRLHRCRTLNDAELERSLRELQVDLVLFTGGGLIRSNLLDVAGHGVLNCHMGILPEYRGMDVVEWPLLRGEPRQVGMTVHFMDKGIDTGDILRIERLQPTAGESRVELRRRFEPAICRLLVETAIDYLEGRVQRRPQREQDGRQYFIMHPALMRIVERKLARGADRQ